MKLAEDYGLPPELGDSVAGGRCDTHHKAGVLVLGVTESADHEAGRSEPDVIEGNVGTAVNVVGSLVGRSNTEQGPICIEADKEVECGERFAATDKSVFAVLRSKSSPGSLLLCGELSELLGDVGEVRPAF